MAAVVAALSLTACQKERFHVEGTITEAKDSTLYIENMALTGPVAIDSVKLDEGGAFSFAPERKANAPEFYRLRIHGTIINLSVDSTETITIKASYPAMAAGYEVEGSDNCSRIKQLALMQMELQNRVDGVMRTLGITVEQRQQQVEGMIEAYKERVRTDYIYKDPRLSSSYFALFQTVWIGNNAALIFNPHANGDDIKTYAAVATSWDALYPNSERGENLHNIAIEGMKNMRIVRNRQNQQIDASKIDETGIIDITLQNNRGGESSLSSLRGNVVLLDFHVYASEGSTERIMALRELYNTYHAQGFDIYQVSLDGDEHFWKTQTSALPWTCVRAGNQAEQVMQLYNITSVPMYYLLDRDCNVSLRDAQVKDIKQSIASLLKQKSHKSSMEGL